MKKLRMALIMLLAGISGYCTATAPAFAANRDICDAFPDNTVPYEVNDAAHLVNPYVPVEDPAHDRRAIA